MSLLRIDFPNYTVETILEDINIEGYASHESKIYNKLLSTPPNKQLLKKFISENKNQVPELGQIIINFSGPAFVDKRKIEGVLSSKINIDTENRLKILYFKNKIHIGLLNKKLLKDWLINNGGFNVNLTEEELIKTIVKRLNKPSQTIIIKNLIYSHLREDVKSDEGIVSHVLTFDNIKDKSDVNLIYILNNIMGDVNKIENWNEDIINPKQLCFNFGEDKEYTVIGVQMPNSLIFCSLIQSYTMKESKRAYIQDGLYTYIIYYNNNEFFLDVTKVELGEIGTKHTCMLYKIYNMKLNNIRLLVAGEFKIENEVIHYNFSSGTIMAEIEEKVYEIIVGSNDSAESARYTKWWGPLVKYIIKKLVLNERIVIDIRSERSWISNNMTKDVIDGYCESYPELAPYIMKYKKICGKDGIKYCK